MKKFSSLFVMVALMAIAVITAPYFYENVPVKPQQKSLILNKEVDQLLKYDLLEDEVQADEKPITFEKRETQVLASDHATKEVEVQEDEKVEVAKETKVVAKETPKQEKKVETKQAVQPVATKAVKTVAPINEDKITKETEVVYEEIGFKSETKNDSSLEKGKKSVQTQGVKGAKEITIEVTYTNGKETSRKQVKETVTKNPVNEVILVGTKELALNCSGLAEDKQLACLVNKARQDAGLSLLHSDSNLNHYASIRATEIVDKFSHTRPNGQAFHTVGSGVHGENISFGYGSAQSAHQGFMDSPGHRANNLHKDFTRIGTALKTDANGTKHWVILFGY